MVLHHELDLFYDTPFICVYSKCKGLKVNARCVTLSHYINDQLPQVDSLILSTRVKDQISEIENTCRNASYTPLFKSWKPSQLCFILNWPTHLFFLSQMRLLVIQYKISILPKKSLLGDLKTCMSWEQECSSTHQGWFNCWRVEMTFIFVSI
jgi:hypothetical protein